MADLTDVEAYRKALADDYSQYVAVDTIDIGGVRAFNRGDAVPASHVAQYGWGSDLVSKVGNKAGQEALAYTPPPTVTPVGSTTPPVIAPSA